MDKQEQVKKLKNAASFIAMFKGSTEEIDEVISDISGEKFHTLYGEKFHTLYGEIKDDFVDGIFCPGCSDQMTIKEVDDGKCGECGNKLDL